MTITVYLLFCIKLLSIIHLKYILILRIKKSIIRTYFRRHGFVEGITEIEENEWAATAKSAAVDTQASGTTNTNKPSPESSTAWFAQRSRLCPSYQSWWQVCGRVLRGWMKSSRNLVGWSLFLFSIRVSFPIEEFWNEWTLIEILLPV